MFFKKNLMFERLESLFRYYRVCSVSELEELDRITCDTYDVTDAEGNVVKKYKTPYTYYFKSGLGTVKIEVDKDFGLDGTEHYLLWYSNYAGSNVFSIDATRKDLKVKPMLGENMLAQDIDLALYEFQSYLQVNLGSSKDIEDRKNNEYKRQLQLHEEQLKILKGV